MDVKTQIARALATKNRQMPLNPVIQALVGEPDPKTMGREQFMRMDGNEAFDTFEGMQSEPGYPWREGRMDGSSFNDAAQYQTADLDAFKLMELDPQYGETAEADINTTEGQRIALLRRMAFADMALEDPRLSEAMTKLDQSVAGEFGAVGRLWTGREYELGRLMADQFANAVLRNDSGAQAPEPEVQRYISQYFPLPNEGPEQLSAKSALRREVIRSLEQALGGDAAPAVAQLRAEMEQLRQQADVPDGSLTGSRPAPAPVPSGDGWQEINGVRVRVKQ
jgi:hypothetical protein